MSNRVDLQPAFVLHTRLYRETSLLVDCLTQEHGRITFIARGARRPKSTFAGLLQPFMPVIVSYLGAGDLKTLTQAEPAGTCLFLRGERLASGLYMNELCIRLLLPQYGVPELFEVYQASLESIAANEPLHASLRLFEKQLLSSLGHDLCLHQDSVEQPIDPDAYYIYDPDRGPYRVTPQQNMGQLMRGQTLLSLAQGDLSCPQACNESRKLLQSMLNPLLGNKPIMARTLIRTAS